MAVTITIAGIQPPAPGKKQGKVHDTTGKSWNVWGDKLHNFAMGQSYSITYDTNEFNGAQFDVIKSFTPASGGPAQQAPQPAQPRAPIQQYNPQPTAKDEMIFVCGALNNSLSNPNINPMMMTGPDIIGLVEKFRMTWRNTLGKTQSNSSDMNDEIPFS